VKRTIETSKTLYRTATFDRSAVDDVSRTLTLSISSDAPYLRSDIFGQPYYEVLDHSTAGVVTDRLDAGIPILFGHDRGQHLGRTTAYNNDGHKLTVTAKFSRSDFAEQKWRDVRDEILVDSSVGYEVVDAEETDQEIDGVPIYRVKFLPLEASLCTIPADPSVGVGRNHQLVRSSMETQTPTKPAGTQPNERTATQERERIQAIITTAKMPTLSRFVDEADVEKAIAENWSKNAFRDFALERMAERQHESSGAIITDEFGPRNGGNRRTVAEQIVAHPEFARVREGGQKTVSIALKGLRSLREAQTRDITTTANVGVTVAQLPGVAGVAYERLTIADLIAPGTMDTGKVVYPQEVGPFVSNAGAVAEAARKPEQSFNVVPAEASAKKIAAWTKISDEMAQDSPAAVAYINRRLGFAVDKAEDKMLLYGDGLNANIKGIMSMSGVQTQAVGSDTIIDCIRKGIGNVDTNTDFMATGIAIHPIDWQSIELIKDTLGRYIVGQVTTLDEFGRARLAPGLWGLPVAISKSTTPGRPIVGAWHDAAQLFRRMGLVIEITNCNDDDFVRNLLTIRAELRAALAVYAPSAFCECLLY
jgi:HK97 family phage major capsid protein